MHCTSPGSPNEKICCSVSDSLNRLRDGLQHRDDNGIVHKNNDIFDDTVCDNLTDEWSSPVHLARSRSWFCCSNEKSNELEPPPLNRPRPISCRYSIVRTEPKSQSEIVIARLTSLPFCCAPFRVKFNDYVICEISLFIFQLQVAALSALKTEVMELSARLQHSERERESVQKKLNDALEEKERSQRRLEAIGSTHESRITEMHCVIVELSRKLKAKQESAIIEEHEPDGSGECSMYYVVTCSMFMWWTHE